MASAPCGCRDPGSHNHQKGQIPFQKMVMLPGWGWGAGGGHLRQKEKQANAWWLEHLAKISVQLVSLEQATEIGGTKG